MFQKQIEHFSQKRKKNTKIEIYFFYKIFQNQKKIKKNSTFKGPNNYWEASLQKKIFIF